MSNTISKKSPVIISTDPGIDDAVAIALATASDNLDVQLICPVAGNVGLEYTTLNTQKILTFFEKNIRIVPGRRQPLLRQLKDASSVHGKTGMEGYDFPEPTLVPDTSVTAAQAMHEVVTTSEFPVTLIAIGPLTDIALYIHQYHQDLPNIDKVVMMGGALGRGNFGVLSEFNFGSDPEAAKIVFQSGLNLQVVPMEIGRQAKIMPATSAKIKDFGKVGDMFYQLFSKYRGGSFRTGLNMYDALAVALVLVPDIFETVDTTVAIETQGRLTAGASLIDLKGYLHQEANATVAISVDLSAFEDWFVRAIQETNN